ncbi:autotransporter outer membrane beta-barrel domain-containing protein [Tianweitania aestuarii]
MRGELGYRFDMKSVAFEPFVNLAHVKVDTDAFTENGGAAALTTEGFSTDTTFTTVGLRAETDFGLAGSLTKATGMVDWRPAFGGRPILPLPAFCSSK